MSLVETARLLASSFSEQPHFIDLFPERQARTRVLPHVFAALLADAQRHGRIKTIDGDGALAGVAVWYPPGAYPLSIGCQVRSVSPMLRLALAAPRSVRRVLQFRATSSKLHPSDRVRDAELAFTPGGPPNWTMHRPGAQR